MKKNSIIHLLLLPILVLLGMCVSCSTPENIGKAWVNRDKLQDKKFNTIFIISMSENIDARLKIEGDLATIAQSRGYGAIKSMDVLPPTFTKNPTPSRDTILKKVREKGCDGILVVSLLKKEEDIRYVPGNANYNSYPYYSWGPTFYGYYDYWYPRLYDPGYYTQDKTYYMLSNFYDATTEEIMWSVTSEVFNPSSLERFSKAFTENLINTLEKENLLLKK